VNLQDARCNNKDHKKIVCFKKATEAKGNTYFMYFPWPPLTGPLTSTFCFFFKHSWKLLFLIKMLLLIHRSPKKLQSIKN